MQAQIDGGNGVIHVRAGRAEDGGEVTQVLTYGQVVVHGCRLCHVSDALAKRG